MTGFATLFTVDSESLRCSLTDLETGLGDHPDQIQRLPLLAQTLTASDTLWQNSGLTKMQEEYAGYVRTHLEIESELALITAQLEAIQNSKNVVVQRRQTLRSELEQLHEKSSLKPGPQIVAVAEKPTVGRYFTESATAPSRISAPAKREKVMQGQDDVSDIICIHELSGECVDPNCRYLHTLR